MTARKVWVATLGHLYDSAGVASGFDREQVRLGRGMDTAGTKGLSEWRKITAAVGSLMLGIPLKELAWYTGRSTSGICAMRREMEFSLGPRPERPDESGIMWARTWDTEWHLRKRVKRDLLLDAMLPDPWGRDVIPQIPPSELES